MPKARIVTKQEFCAYCNAAKRLLDLNDIEYAEEVLGEHLTKEELMEEFSAKGLPPPATVPQIFIDDVYIGGHSQLVPWIADFKKANEDAADL